MTLQEAKDQVAKNNVWESWSEVIDWHNREKLQNEIGEFVDEVSELYAQSQVNDALDKAIEIVNKEMEYSVDDLEYKATERITEELKRLKR